MFEPEAAPVNQTNPTVPLNDAPIVPQQNLPFRLLKDERVIGSFPITQKRRPLGKLASFLFITDSRVVYAAEAKSIVSSSTVLKEYQVPSVTGVQVSRHRGLDSLGAAALLGAVLNFIAWLSLGGWLASLTYSFTGGFSSYDGGSSGGGAAIAWPFVVLAIGSLVIGAIAVLVLARSSGEIQIVGPRDAQTLAKEGDLPKILVTILLFLIFGLFIALALIAWVILRELGIFRAADAALYADTKNLDHVSYEAGALIIDVQARGTLAGQE